jgi:hypothetical protein|tara:strand:+ start:1253 stop:1795 length:543 start_codon:yes stop_codon:yes gene_type:complete
MSYFDKFPLLVYDAKGQGNYKLVTDILRRVKIRSAIQDGAVLFDKYDVKNGENPEDVAFKWFGSADLHWVILLTNDITDRYYDWPLNQVQFAEFLKDKYGAGNEDAVHHYEITKSSGKTSSSGPSDYSHKVEVNSDEDNASSVSNREYEERLQDKKRQIKLLNKSFLPEFIEEFDILIRQ